MNVFDVSTSVFGAVVNLSCQGQSWLEENAERLEFLRTKREAFRPTRCQTFLRSREIRSLPATAKLVVARLHENRRIFVLGGNKYLHDWHGFSGQHWFVDDRLTSHQNQVTRNETVVLVTSWKRHTPKWGFNSPTSTKTCLYNYCFTLTNWDNISWN